MKSNISQAQGIIVKTTVLFLVFSLFAAPIMAELTVVGPKRNVFNLGEAVPVDIFILSDFSRQGFLRTVLACDFLTTNKTYPLAAESVSLTAGQAQTLSKEFIVPRIPGTSQGVLCRFMVGLESNGTIVDVGQSRMFAITEALAAKFAVSNKTIQLGSKILISGDIKGASGELLDSVVTLYLRQGESDYLINTINTEGSFSYSFDSKGNPPGIYNVDFFVSDKFGNQMLFKDAINFKVSDLIFVSLAPEKRDYAPGDKMTVSGTAQTEYNFPIEGSKVVLRIDNFPFITEVNKGKFSYEFNLKENIKSGKHDITAEVTDVFGNKGESYADFIIIPVPTNLSARVSYDSLTPGSDIEIIPVLLDQGSDALARNSVVQLFDSKNNKVLDAKTISGQSVSYVLSDFALPGRYRIIVTSEGLTWHTDLEVAEVESLQYSLVENQGVAITNLGNIRFKDVVIASLQGTNNASYVLDYKVSLDSNETIVLDFTKQVAEGNYSVYLSTRLGNESLGVLPLPDNRNFIKRNLFPGTGNVIGASSSAGSVLFVFIVLALVVALFVVRQNLHVSLMEKLNLKSSASGPGTKKSDLGAADINFNPKDFSSGLSSEKGANANSSNKESRAPKDTESLQAEQFNEYLREKRNLNNKKKDNSVEKIRSDPEIVKFLDNIKKD